MYFYLTRFIAAVFSEALIDRIFDAIEELDRGRNANRSATYCYNYRIRDVVMKNNKYISFIKKAVRELLLQPIIRAIALKLIKTDTV